jgi:ribosomal-protein-alanine N-acetyltransferase
MTEILICLAETEHLTQVADLEQSLNPHAPWSASMLTESVLAGAVVWVLIVEDQVVGYLVFDCLFEISQILAIGVDPKYQRKGLAKQVLMQYVETQRAAGTAELLLEVATTNQAAIALYVSLGFSRVGLRRGYYQEPESGIKTDALVLKLMI